MNTGKQTILVVDDDPGVRNILVTFLRREGYFVGNADSGSAAIKALSVVDVDIILSDVQMPNGDGFYLLKEVRKRYAKLPVFLMTGKTEITKEEAIQRGAHTLLHKPLDFDSLLEEIKKLFDRSEHQKT